MWRATRGTSEGVCAAREMDRENLGNLLNGAEVIEKRRASYSLLPLCCSSLVGLVSSISRSRRQLEGWSEDCLPSVEVDWIKECFKQMRCAEAPGAWQDAPRSAAGIGHIARLLLIVFERSWWLANVLENWKKADSTLMFQKSKELDLGSYRPVNLALTLGRMRLWNMRDNNRYWV